MRRFFSPRILEEKVCNHRCQSLEEMKNAISKEIAAIPPEMILRIIEILLERL